MLRLFMIQFIVLVFLFIPSNCSKNAGHLKQFGCCGIKHEIDHVKGWPDIKTFFNQYGKTNTPLVIKGGANISPASRLWTDEYFLNTLPVPTDQMLQVEKGKVEERDGEGDEMNFRDYVKQYNSSDMYMVTGLPGFLGRDLVMPPVLQCSPVIAAINKAVLWFSSGGTKSVIHNDEYDNLICIYRGKKHFIMVDPHKFGDKINLKKKGSYSAIDVEKVDFDKYPSLESVEYYDVILEKGDCMYIPYRWIHQVNSYGSNIAVNIWLFNLSIRNLDVSRCKGVFNPKLTMTKIFGDHFTGGNEELEEDLEHLIESSINANDTIAFDTLSSHVFHKGLEKYKTMTLHEYLKFLYTNADEDGNGIVDREEVFGIKLHTIIDLVENLRKVKRGHGKGLHDEL